MNDKASGSYYTPKNIVSFMVEYAMNTCEVSSVLEPSFGDGRFLNEINNYRIENIVGVEIDSKKSKDFANINKYNNTIINKDFLEYCLKSEKKFDLIIGNPPYINKKNLQEATKSYFDELLKLGDFPKKLNENLWVAFIIGSLKLLNKNGNIFFILPSEFLQVQYAEPLRNFLLKKFENIEIIEFEEKLFPEIEQNVCLMFLKSYNLTESKNNLIRYKRYDCIDAMKIIYSNEISSDKLFSKWSNAILSENEVDLILKLSLNLEPIKSYCESSPGIVTGANDYFIVNNKQVNNLKIEKMCIPIVKKSSYIKNTLILTKKIFDEIAYKEEPFFLMNLNYVNEKEFSEELVDYLNSGVQQGINNRYKCSKRKRWYDIPILRKGDLFFFKRFNRIPKFIVNEHDIHATDISYNVRVNEGVDKYSFAFCFYNTLTIVLSELYGRYYGGGVAELVPSEFQSLSIPYKKIRSSSIKKLNRMFEKSYSENEIIDYVDSKVLYLSDDDKKVLREVRDKLLKRRGII